MTADLRPQLARPHVAPAGVDLSAAARAGHEFLAALGVPTDTLDGGDAGWQLAHAYATVLVTAPPAPTVQRWPNQDLMVLPAVSVWSLCPEHLLPISGRADVGYLPRGLVIPPPMLAEALRYLAAPPQPVSRLAGQLADWVQAAVRPAGCGVTVRLDHTCPSDTDPPGTQPNVTSTALRGLLRDDRSIRTEFLTLTSTSTTQDG
jgi:GTP cyclohydrolase I